MEKEIKKTKREYYEELLTITEVSENEELVAFIGKQIEALDKRAAKAKEKEKDVDTLKNEVIGVLSAKDYMIVANIVAAIGKEDVTAAKVIARLSKAVKDGVVEKAEVKVDKSKLMGYKLATDTDATEVTEITE